MILTRTVFPNRRRGHLQRQSHPGKPVRSHRNPKPRKEELTVIAASPHGLRGSQLALGLMLRSSAAGLCLTGTYAQ